MRIAVVAPSCPLKREAAERVQNIVAKRGDCELVIHPQCFLADGHFAGPDDARLAALSEVMADPSVDAVWFARGGYGSNRIAEAAKQFSEVSKSVADAFGEVEDAAEKVGKSAKATLDDDYTGTYTK